MRVIVMRIQISQTFFIALQILVNFFSFVAKFFFSQKIKKKVGRSRYILTKNQKIFDHFLKHVFHYPRVRVHFIIKYVLEMNTNPENVKNLDLVFQHFF